MYNKGHKMNTRRDFLKKLGVVGCSAALLGKIDLSAIEIDLSRINLSDTNYKAMVHIMLLGGNDSVNMLVDYESEAYEDYKNIRPSVAIKKEELIPLGKTDYKYALHPRFENLASMFEKEELAFVANVGTLIEPTTKDTIKNVKLPSHLFSHSDQRKYWENLNPYEIAKTGWGGRIADALDLQGYDNLPPIYGLNADGMWLRANHTKAYIFDTKGTIAFNKLQEGSDLRNSLDRIHDENRLNLLTKAYRDLFRNTLNRNESLDNLLNSSSVDVELSIESDFALKLQLITKIIDLRESFFLPRQMFYVGVGGFDTHGNQVATHNNLYNVLDNGLKDFNNALKQIGMFENTVTFITSDFGRTVTSNASGTDHGWGGHYFVMGGAVKGGAIYGDMPSLKLDSNNLTKSKRLIPTISVEQYVATICKWYGLEDSNLNEIFPNLKNFEKRDLGFMKA